MFTIPFISIYVVDSLTKTLLICSIVIAIGFNLVPWFGYVTKLSFSYELRYSPLVYSENGKNYFKEEKVCILNISMHRPLIYEIVKRFFAKLFTHNSYFLSEKEFRVLDIYNTHIRVKYFNSFLTEYSIAEFEKWFYDQINNTLKKRSKYNNNKLKLDNIFNNFISTV